MTTDDLFATKAKPFEGLREAYRRAPDYIEPCPLCSFLGVQGFPDTIRKPSIDKSARSGTFSLSRCCSISEGCPRLPSTADVAAWWRERRQQALDNIALDNRRKSTLVKLLAAGWEAL